MAEIYRALAFRHGLIVCAKNHEVFNHKDLSKVLEAAEDAHKKKKGEYAIAVIRHRRRGNHSLLYYLRSAYCKHDFPMLFDDEKGL